MAVFGLRRGCGAPRANIRELWQKPLESARGNRYEQAATGRDGLPPAFSAQTFSALGFLAQVQQRVNRATGFRLLPVWS